MTNKVLNNSTLSVEKLRAALQELRERTAGSTALSEILGEALAVFKRFYQELGDPEFRPHYLETGDTPRSEVYNLNLSQLDADIGRFYAEVSSLAQAQVASFNYANIVNAEITRRADALASRVLDLKILSDFTRGDVLIAGDDFRSLENVDNASASGAPKAEKMLGTGGMSLRRKDNRNISRGDTDVEILPLSPADTGGGVNSKATPGNLKRFYEGQYYSFVGQARPEGGSFNIKFLLRPVEDVPVEEGENAGDVGQPKRTTEKDAQGVTHVTVDDSEKYSNQNAGFFVELGANENANKLTRTRMFDGDPSTFWEAEYVYHIPTPLIEDVIDEASVESDSNKEDKGHKDNIPRTATVVIDYRAAERAAKDFDFDGRDLIVDMVITLPEQTNINYVVLDPILFGANAFMEVLGIHTADEEEGQFLLVDGWDATRYAKTITPEANEFLNDVQVGQLLSPSRYEYTGKGVFPFPSRVAKKVRIRLKMDNPVPNVYERYYILMRQQLEYKTTVKTVTRRGFFRRFCWVARVVVPDRWTDARAYILWIGPKWFKRLYGKYGERTAVFLLRHKWMIYPLKPLFWYMAWRGKKRKAKFIARLERHLDEAGKAMKRHKE
jgi:hypothetical protein